VFSKGTATTVRQTIFLGVLEGFVVIGLGAVLAYLGVTITIKIGQTVATVPVVIPCISLGVAVTCKAFTCLKYLR
jgi:hypothetical protein